MVAEHPEPRRKPMPIPPRGPKPPSGPVKVTPEMVPIVASKVCKGLPLRFALRLAHERLTEDQWQKSLINTPKLARDYELKVAQLLEQDLDTITGTERSKMPVGTCWKLERRFPNDFAQPKAGGNQPITINVGVQVDVRKRAAMLRRRIRVIADAGTGQVNNETH